MHNHSMHLVKFQYESLSHGIKQDVNWENCCSLEGTKHLNSCDCIFRTACVKYQKYDLAKS